MPHVATGDGLDRPQVDLSQLVLELGPAPWRVSLVGTPRLRVVLLCWEPGFATTAHAHPGGDEVFHVIDGQAAFSIGEEPEREVGPGAFLFAARGVRHAIRVSGTSPLVLLAAVAPNEDRDDETVELDDG